jgi:hypothetical protein
MIASPDRSHRHGMYSGSVSPHMKSLVRDAEGCHCSSFPSVLLQLIQAGTRPSQVDQSTTIELRQNELFVLVCTAKSFDAGAWARKIQPLSPTADIEQRTMVVRAHKAAVIIYLSRLLFSSFPTVKPSCDFEALVTEALDNIPGIDINSPLFTATTWPTSIAGAETCAIAKQQWVGRRFTERWTVKLWGLLKGALKTIQTIWDLKDGGTKNKRITPSSKCDIATDGHWVSYLRETGVDWLVL